MKTPAAIPGISLLLLSIIFGLTNGCTHQLKNGIYRGTELITVSPNNQYWPGNIKAWSNMNDSLNLQWFHEVAITINDSNVTVIKRPFYIKDGTKRFSDSTGGFYYYKADVDYDKKDKSTTLSCNLDSCHFCPKLPTATPLYMFEHYEIRRQKNKLLINTNSEKGLIFTKQ